MPLHRASRREFLGLIAAAVAAGFVPFTMRAGRVFAASGDHPDPRPGIDASKVLTTGGLTAAPHLAPLFDRVREMPHIVDGIRCYCGCAHIEGYRSLLSCYEHPGMAQFCEICQGQAKLVYGRWKEGQTLEQIRRAVDARYAAGPGLQQASRQTLRAPSQSTSRPSSGTLSRTPSRTPSQSGTVAASGEHDSCH